MRVLLVRLGALPVAGRVTDAVGPEREDAGVDLDLLENYSIEVDSRHDGSVWFTLWHDNCGTFLIEDYARRMGADLRELYSLAASHDADCPH